MHTIVDYQSQNEIGNLQYDHFSYREDLSGDLF